ncbi:hypothetical protein H632_c2314p0, partial [Helicosporidium sp. ATCC 50920]
MVKPSDGVIRAIAPSAVHRICSGQVIVDLATAVKELVENALDAGATSIEVRLKEYGSELIESLATFGFRGEALSSLCAVAQVSVVTRTRSQSTATRLRFDHEGALQSQTPCARAAGTTVSVADLFSPLPVRRRSLEGSIRREYAKLGALLQAYALFAPRVRFVATNQTGAGARTTV